ncbi:TlpA disulfide reductase family protein [Pseudomonas sp. DTU_2021_1001937_2_SI_NGA_ILE_001]|uniref:TlpA disulfide reductase family protein n=1 Tax=Pseudomonas sp. DTU_2021_1001937_2_SI_NGA_ILE_001 TaxID=3077589 RepID=UPI0028FC2DFB|nr:TlpA disulfide reductase family protein [Pseudomonas sp. DTU_2021_1001937_2_SI_NGA_ILE_001]WNW13402.1 TlpA disulfide reductase family protein [Pseudomonas sp. DTU_2021_1001937_2_SI_NGA_ILE_001]
MLTLNLGPLALAMHHVLIIASMLLATLCGWWAGRRVGCNPEKHLFHLLIVAVLVARAAFVASFLAQYREQPWGILDLRDGGFIAWPGIAAALLVGIWKLYRHPEQRRPLGLAICTGLLCWGAGSLTLEHLQRQSRLPDLPLTDLEARPVNLKDYQGKPVVINLWATWCPPCRREMPVLAKAQASRPDITLVFVNQGETPDEVRRFLQSQGLALDNLLLDANSELGRQAGSMALPTTLFYDAQGHQVGNHLGELSAASLEQALQALE